MNRILPLAIATALALASCGSGDEATAPAADTTPELRASTTDLTTTTLGTSTTSPPSDPAPSSEPASTPVNLVADDVAYAPISELQRLDIYTPSTGAPPYPVLVIIHGGGWTVGDKRGELPVAAIPGFLDLGFAVASINYRLAPDAVFPAQLLDAKAAIRYLRNQAAVYGLDPERIAVMGESAGAHLAALLGTTQGRAEFDDPALGNPDVSSDVQAVVDFYGPADLTTSDTQRALNPPCPAEPDPNITLLLGASPTEAPDLAAAASPITYLHPPGQDVPPFFIAHGDADCVVPYQQSAELHDAIQAVAPGRSQLIIVPDSGHYLDFDFQSVSEAVTTFLNVTIGTPASS
jgi:acetyl esterase/lipase